MHIVRLFIASSIVEFKHERKRIGALVSDANSLCMPYGTVLVADFCEDQSSALALSRKQEEYNQLIRQDQLFVLLVGSTVGTYTMEELVVALDSQENSGIPQGVLALCSPTVGNLASASSNRTPRAEDTPGTEVASLLDGRRGCTLKRFQNADEAVARIFDCLHEMGLVQPKLCIEGGRVRQGA